MQGVDIQVAPFMLAEDIDFGNAIGIPIEVGARGKAIQIWAVHHSIPQLHDADVGSEVWASALSSNPEHAPAGAPDLDVFMGSSAIYARSIYGLEKIITGPKAYWTTTRIIPCYGIVRPRRQVWVLFLIGFKGSHRPSIEIYYSEIGGTREDIDAVDRKHGKYRRT